MFIFKASAEDGFTGTPLDKINIESMADICLIGKLVVRLQGSTDECIEPVHMAAAKTLHAELQSPSRSGNLKRKIREAFEAVRSSDHEVLTKLLPGRFGIIKRMPALEALSDMIAAVQICIRMQPVASGIFLRQEHLDVAEYLDARLRRPDDEFNTVLRQFLAAVKTSDSIAMAWTMRLMRSALVTGAENGTNTESQGMSGAMAVQPGLGDIGSFRSNPKSVANGIENGANMESESMTSAITGQQTPGEDDSVALDTAESRAIGFLESDPESETIQFRQIRA